MEFASIEETWVTGTTFGVRVIKDIHILKDKENVSLWVTCLEIKTLCCVALYKLLPALLYCMWHRAGIHLTVKTHFLLFYSHFAKSYRYSSGFSYQFLLHVGLPPHFFHFSQDAGSLIIATVLATSFQFNIQSFSSPPYNGAPMRHTF